MNPLFFARRFVDVGNGGDLAVFTDHEFPRHGASNKSEASGFFRGRNHDLA